MNPIQPTFLRSKHWEIFLLWIAVKWFLRMTINALLGNPLFSSPHASDIFIVRLLHQSGDIVLYVWAYFTGSFFNSISPARCRVSSTGFFLALVGLLVLDLLPGSWGLSGLAVFVNFAFFLLCSAYVVRFPSKTLVAAEEQELAPVSEYINEFILVFFYPVGIWFIQPRVNELYAAHQNLAAPAGSIRPADHVST